MAAHCDDLVVHAPGKCVFCDEHAKKEQEDRVRDGVNFSDENNQFKKPCPASLRRPVGVINRWHGNRAITKEELEKTCPKCGSRLSPFISGCLNCTLNNVMGETEFPETKAVAAACICVAGPSRFCPVHGSRD